VNKEENMTVAWPMYAGVVALVAGVALIALSPLPCFKLPEIVLLFSLPLQSAQFSIVVLMFFCIQYP
jgi:hypothetical protein